MPNMKGSAFTARLQFLRDRFPDRWEPFLESLSAESRKLATGRLLSHEWYPLAAFIELNLCADRLMGNGDLALSRTLGAHAAEVNLPTLYKLFYRVGSPETVIRKASSLWSLHHDSGEARLITLDSGQVEFQVHDYAAPHPVVCRSLEGFIERTLLLTGVRDLELSERQCVCKGADFCAFRGRWRV